jgi:hypothetical protein
MYPHAEAIDTFFRLLTVAVVIGVGISEFGWPQRYIAPRRLFGCAPGADSQQQARFEAAVAARQIAEDVPLSYGRVLGIATIVLGLTGLLPFVPVILPYALSCLAVASFALLAYLRFKRATTRRFAPLVRRSSVAVVSPIAIGAILCCALGMLALASDPAYRVSALIAAAATLMLGYVAWRIAQAPALLLGGDPELEYAIDERLRVARARNIAAVACAPAVVVIGFAYPGLLVTYQGYATIALSIVYGAFFLACFGSCLRLPGRAAAA